MNNLDKQYQNLLQDILDNGVTKQDRTRTGTISVFGRQIRHKMSDGFPLLTTKKMHFKSIVTELLWFLRGDTNIKYLVDNGCHIWDGDSFSNYIKWWEESDDSCNLNEEQSNKWLKLVDGGLQWAPLSQEEFINKIKTDDVFAKKWGELGPIYGAQWRSWVRAVDYDIDYENGINDEIDQIANLINDLKTNPDSRRLMVSAWNVGEIDSMVLPPCHFGFQVYTRELSRDERIQIYVNQYMGGVGRPAGFEDAKLSTRNIPTRAISLMWNQRSVDTFLGLPFNIASYGLLLEIIAKEVNMIPDELIGNLGDVHLYQNHLEQAKEQIGRELTARERTALGSNGSTRLYDSIEEENYQTVNANDVMHTVCDDRGIIRHTREPYPLPKLLFKDHLDQFDSIIDILRPIDFILDNYQSHPTIKAPLSN
jgi:thymidylate synthase